MNVSSRRQTLSGASPRSVKQQDESVPHLSQLEVALRMLELYADILCHKGEVTNIKKFARTVTNKVTTTLVIIEISTDSCQWLLHLLADDESTVVVLAAKILARLLVINGPDYVQKFVDKTGGIIILRHRFKRWWSVPTIWLICFAIFFGLDPAQIDSSRVFDMFTLLETFAPDGQVFVVNPALLPVLTAMLEQGLKTVIREQMDPESPLTDKSNGKTPIPAQSPVTPSHLRQRSMTLSMEPSTTSKHARPFALLLAATDARQPMVQFPWII